MKTLDLFRLDGKVALVSGGAGIVGRHIVRGLMEAGATVIVAARRASAEPEAEGEQCDFASEAEIRALRERILDRHGRIDVLFNNAVARAGGELMDTSGEQWESVMALNSTGLFLSCRLFAEAMIDRKSGSIINVASIYGMVGPDFHIYEGTEVHNSVSYAFAKGGMINLTRYLASFLAPHGVRVNTLSPGGVLSGQPQQFIESYARRCPMGRMMNGDELRGAAVFLASDASAYITGQNLAVDGGWTAI
jgi:NAD(P)-dependent dehydrogenase (short-subunit alcohol dehydrogenase family)